MYLPQAGCALFLSFALLWSSFIPALPALAADPPAPKAPSQPLDPPEMKECIALPSSCQSIAHSYEAKKKPDIARLFYRTDCWEHDNLESCLHLGLSDADQEFVKTAEEDCGAKLNLRRCIRGVGWQLRENRAAGIARLEDLCLRKSVNHFRRPEVCSLLGASLKPPEKKPYIEQCFSAGTGCIIAAGGTMGRGATMLLLGSACQRNWVGACILLGGLESESMIAQARDLCAKGDDMACTEVFGFEQGKDPKSAATTSLGTTLCGKGYGPVCASMKLPTPKSSEHPKN